jgi:hypothetical protein
MPSGRQTKLTPQLTQKICDAIRAGNYAKVACAMVGISEAIYYRWLQYGRQDNAEPIYLEFVESIERAEAEAEVHAVALIKKAANDGSLAASQWYLERKHSDRWGRKDSVKQEISGTLGVNLFKTIDDARAAVLEFLEEDNDGSITIRTDEGETENGTPELGSTTTE